MALTGLFPSLFLYECKWHIKFIAGQMQDV